MAQKKSILESNEGLAGTPDWEARDLLESNQKSLLDDVDYGKLDERSYRGELEWQNFDD